MTLRRWRVGFALLLMLLAVSGCDHSHHAGGARAQQRSRTVKLVSPSVSKARRAVARYVETHSRRFFIANDIECEPYGALSLNCYADTPTGCRVLGVEQTQRGRMIVTHPFGITLCASNSQTLTITGTTRQP